MSGDSLRFVTLTGVPLRVSELKWPFHASTSGSDWYVLHGRVELLQSEEGLHADVAVGMTQTMKDALGSLEPEHAEGMVINAIRKTIDNGQLAFLKSGKLQPAHVTSRFYSFAAKKVQFPQQAEPDVRTLIRNTVFWLGAGAQVAHPYDCQYVNLSRERMLELAAELAGEGLITLNNDHAAPTPALQKLSAEIHAAMHKGVEAGKAATRISA